MSKIVEFLKDFVRTEKTDDDPKTHQIKNGFQNFRFFLFKPDRRPDTLTTPHTHTLTHTHTQTHTLTHTHTHTNTHTHDRLNLLLLSLCLRKFFSFSVYPATQHHPHLSDPIDMTANVCTHASTIISSRGFCVRKCNIRHFVNL